MGSQGSLGWDTLGGIPWGDRWDLGTDGTLGPMGPGPQGPPFGNIFFDLFPFYKIEFIRPSLILIFCEKFDYIDFRGF